MKIQDPISGKWLVVTSNKGKKILKLYLEQVGGAGSSGASTEEWWLERFLSEHSETTIPAVAVSADGKMIVSAGRNDKTIIWNAESGKKLYSLSAPRSSPWGTTTVLTTVASVNAVAVFPDGKKIASGSYDGTVRIWDAKSGDVFRTLSDTLSGGELPAHYGSVTAIAVFPDGTKVVSGSHDHTVKIWNVDTGDELHTLSANASVNTVAVFPDGKKVILGTGSWNTNGIIKIWDTESGEEHNLSNLPGHNNTVSSVAVFPDDSNRVVSGSYDKTVKIWNADSGEKFHTLLHNTPVTAVAVFPDGTKIVSGSALGMSGNDGVIRIWNADSGEKLYTIPKRNTPQWRGVSAVAVFPDGKRVVSGWNDGVIRIWKMNANMVLGDWATRVLQGKIKDKAGENIELGATTDIFSTYLPKVSESNLKLAQTKGENNPKMREVRGKIKHQHIAKSIN